MDAVRERPETPHHEGAATTHKEMKMKKLVASALCGCILLVTACGRISQKVALQDLSQNQAVEVLTSVPQESITPGDVSARGLEAVLNDLIDSGKVAVPRGARGAVQASGSGTSSLGTLLQLLAQNPNLTSVAQGMVSSSQGSPTRAKFSLDTIFMILQAALPIVMVFAPHFAVIIQAVLTIVPAIKQLIDTIKNGGVVPTSAGLRLQGGHTQMS